MTRYGYRGYGLSLVSELELPEYLPAPVSDDPDIRISLDAGALDAWEGSAGAMGEFELQLDLGLARGRLDARGFQARIL